MEDTQPKAAYSIEHLHNHPRTLLLQPEWLLLCITTSLCRVVTKKNTVTMFYVLGNPRGTSRSKEASHLQLTLKWFQKTPNHMYTCVCTHARSEMYRKNDKAEVVNVNT